MLYVSRTNNIAKNNYHCYGGTIVDRTYGIHKNLYIYLFLLRIFGPIYYGPPSIVAFRQYWVIRSPVNPIDSFGNTVLRTPIVVRLSICLELPSVSVPTMGEGSPSHHEGVN